MKRIIVALIVLLTVAMQMNAQPLEDRHRRHEVEHLFIQKGLMGWSVCNEKGERISDYFDEIRPFYDGMAAVRTMMGWSFIDSEGKKINSYFEEVNDFHDDRALVRSMMGWCFIDREGERKGDYYQSAESFHGGVALVKSMMGWFFINAKGERITDYHSSPDEIRRATVPNRHRREGPTRSADRRD